MLCPHCHSELSLESVKQEFCLNCSKPLVRGISRRKFLAQSAVLGIASATMPAFLSAPGVASATGNTIQNENAKPGTTGWQLTAPVTYREPDTNRSRAIEGFASKTSVNKGESINFYVSCRTNTAQPTGSPYTMQFYRLGYYGGLGGRLMTLPGGITTVLRSVGYDQTTPPNPPYDCSFWQDPYTITIPTDVNDWVSGIYVVKLTSQSTGLQNYIIFVVRDDARASDFLFQSSVTSYQAYNCWGGKSLYDFNSTPTLPADYPHKATYTVSFNRPYAIPSYQDAANGAGAGDFFTHDFGDKQTNLGFPVSSAGWEYNMVRWLEANNFDVTYCTNIDVHRDSSLLLSHRGFLSVGHDEYWSRQMRINVENARDQGVNVAFFSANSLYTQIRFNIPDPQNPQNEDLRTMICYVKNYAEDPVFQRITQNPSTATPDDLLPYPKVATFFQYVGDNNTGDGGPSALSPVNWPENSLLGGGGRYFQHQAGVCYSDYWPIVIQDSSHWICNNTGLVNGSQIKDLLGYEYSVDEPNNSARPQGLRVIANSPTGFGSDSAAMTAYKAISGSIVFSAGTVQWSWGLDHFQLPGIQAQPHYNNTLPNPVVQRMTRNILERFTRTTSGEVAIYTITSQGTLEGPYNGVQGNWSSTWRTVASIQFSDNQEAGLLFYDAIAGRIAIYTVSNQGLINGPINNTLISQSHAWRSIIPVRFSNGSQGPGVLFYDAIAGTVTIYTVTSQGVLTQLGNVQSVRKNLRIVIPVKFYDTQGSGILFYDPYAREGIFYTVNDQGVLTQLGPTQTNWRKTWHTMLPIQFFDTQGWGLLFYDAVAGEGAVFAINSQGTFGQIGNTLTNWRKTWRSIVPIRFRDTQGPGLLFYDAIAGEGAVFVISSQGSLGGPYGDVQTTWRKSWQSIVSIDQRTSPSAYPGLLWYDQDPGTP